MFFTNWIFFKFNFVLAHDYTVLSQECCRSTRTRQCAVATVLTAAQRCCHESGTSSRPSLHEPCNVLKIFHAEFIRNQLMVLIKTCGFGKAKTLSNWELISQYVYNIYIHILTIIVTHKMLKYYFNIRLRS